MISTPITLLAAGSYSSSASAGTAFQLAREPFAGVFQLKVTVAPSTSTPTATADVYLLHSVDGGTTYDAFLHFPQVTNGAAAVASTIASWSAGIAASSSLNMHAASVSSLAAGQVINGPVGGYWKVGYTIANGFLVANSSAYQFSVVGQLYSR